MKLDTKPFEEKMKKSISVYQAELETIRAGRANPKVLDKVAVDYYGVATPVNQLASVSVTEARTLMIQPYDSSVLRGIEKAIQCSDIGINPQNDGRAIRLVVPPLTEDRRKEIVKEAAKMAEDTKVQIRNVRRETMDTLKKMKKEGELTEDDLKQAEKKVQDITDKFIKETDKVSEAKQKEIMEI